MYKLASIAFSAALGIAGLAHTVSAEACPTVGFEGPRIGFAGPGVYPAFYRPYYGHDRYWRADRYDHFHHRWERGERRWDGR